MPLSEGACRLDDLFSSRLEGFIDHDMECDDEGSTPSTRFGGNHLAERAATLAQVAVLLWRMGW
jgi:hypothetical protein